MKKSSSSNARDAWHHTLNRLKVLNALNDELMDALGAALLAFDADDEIGAIVITGSPRAFAAGASWRPCRVSIRERLFPPDNKNLRRFRLPAKVSVFA